MMLRAKRKCVIKLYEMNPHFTVYTYVPENASLLSVTIHGNRCRIVSGQFRRVNICYYESDGYTIDVMRQTACLSVNLSQLAALLPSLIARGWDGPQIVCAPHSTRMPTGTSWTVSTHRIFRNTQNGIKSPLRVR